MRGDFAKGAATVPLSRREKAGVRGNGHARRKSHADWARLPSVCRKLNCLLRVNTSALRLPPRRVHTFFGWIRLDWVGFDAMGLDSAANQIYGRARPSHSCPYVVSVFRIDCFNHAPRIRRVEERALSHGGDEMRDGFLQPRIEGMKRERKGEEGNVPESNHAKN